MKAPAGIIALVVLLTFGLLSPLTFAEAGQKGKGKKDKSDKVVNEVVVIYADDDNDKDKDKDVE